MTDTGDTSSIIYLSPTSSANKPDVLNIVNN